MPILNNFTIRGVLGYQDLFRQPAPKDHLDKLSPYPTDILIMALAKINAILFHYGRGSGGSIDSDKIIFKLVFNTLDKRPFKHLLEELESKQDTITIFSPQPIVMLMGQLISRFKPVNDNDVASEKNLGNMFKQLFLSILATNDLYYQSIGNKNVNSPDHLWKLELRQQEFARKVYNIFGVIPLKTFLFFRFIGERYGDSVLTEFAESFGIPSAHNYYFNFLQTIATFSSKFESDGQPRYIIVDETLRMAIKPFVFDPTDAGKASYLGESYALINQPFYQLKEGVVILDYAFFSHLTDTSLLFHFYQNTSLRKIHGIKNYNEYLGIVGKHFFEEYLLLQLIKKQFTHPHDKVLSEKDDPQYPDILLVHNRKDAFVIEVKSTRVHGKVLDDADVSGFQKFLEDNFASEKTKAGEKNKGIFQLKKQIQYLKKKEDKLRIFPIIIYTEPSLDIAGVNTFLDDKFEDTIKSERTTSGKIYPLTCINLDFFIKFHPSLKNERYFLRDRIIEYHQKRKSKLNSAAKKKKHYLYFMAQYSFMRVIERTYPMVEAMEYFKQSAQDFGFKTESDDPSTVIRT